MHYPGFRIPTHPGAEALDAGRLGPETAALERIGGQFESAARTWVPLMVQCREVGPVPGDIGRGQRFCDLTPRVSALAQRHDRTRCGRGFGPDLQCGRGQNRLRTDLHQHRAAQRRHRAHAFGELHRLTRMPPPILSVQRGFRCEHRAGPVADQRPGGHGELQLAPHTTRTRRAPAPSNSEWKA